MLGHLNQMKEEIEYVVWQDASPNG